MNVENRLGSIKKIRMGYGGYQDAMFGVTVELGGDGWGVGDFKGMWADDPDKYCKWSVSDQDKSWGDMVRWLRDLMQDAKVDSLEKLKGKPVEITFDGNTLKSWRILKEVIG